MRTALVNSNLDPTQEFQGIPLEDDFSGMAFLKSDEIKEIAEALIKKSLSHLVNVRIEYFWKRKGGRGGGKVTLGKCQRPSGLLAHYCPGAIVIWLGADHCKNLKLTRFQVEALIYHELNHIEVTDEGVVGLKKHDFEGFGDEIVEYGFWNTGLQEAAQAVNKTEMEVSAAA